MSTRWDDYDNRRICLFPVPRIEKKRDIGIYSSGALFAIGWWCFIDAVVFANYKGDDVITFVDWMSGIISTLGMIIVNSIDKSRLAADNFTYSGSGVATKARLFLFIGLSMMAGGLAGSVTVLILKYILNDDNSSQVYYGAAEVAQNGAIMLSSIVLWVAQNTPEDYNYSYFL